MKTKSAKSLRSGDVIRIGDDTWQVASVGPWFTTGTYHLTAVKESADEATEVASTVVPADTRFAVTGKMTNDELVDMVVELIESGNLPPSVAWS